MACTEPAFRPRFLVPWASVRFSLGFLALVAGAMALARSRREAPRTSMQRKSVSNEVASEDLSSLDTRDWPDPSNRARSAWLSERDSRRWRIASAIATFISTNCSSASVRPKSSPTVPNLKPAASRRFLRSASIGSLLGFQGFGEQTQSAPAGLFPSLRSLLRLLVKHTEHENHVGQNMIENAPLRFLGGEPKLMAAGPDVGPWLRARRAETLSSLDKSEKVPGVHSGLYWHRRTAYCLCPLGPSEKLLPPLHSHSV